MNKSNLFESFPPYNSDTLLNAVESESDKLQMLVENFIPEKSITMLAAPSGCGKSTISMQLACELSCGMFCFQGMPTTRPLKVYYIMFESFAHEFFHRVKSFKSRQPYNPDNLWIDDGMKGANTLNERHVHDIIERIETYCQRPDIIFIDPIYACVPGGLSKDEPAAMFTRFCNILQGKFQCALWLNHHTSRDIYQEGKKVDREKSFYGSTWLDALVTGMYEMSIRKDDSGSTLTRKKDRFGCLLKEIPLTYDQFTNLSIISQDYTDGSKHNRIVNFLNKMYAEKKEFTYTDIMHHSGASNIYVKKVCSTINIYIESTQNIGKQTYFKTLKPVPPLKELVKP